LKPHQSHRFSHGTSSVGLGFVVRPAWAVTRE
jgi:hypothetical protein